MPGLQHRVSGLVPPSFSFNSPLGMCPGVRAWARAWRWIRSLSIQNPKLSIRGGAIEPWAASMERGDGWVYSIIRALSDEFGIDLRQAVEGLTAKQQHLVLLAPATVESRCAGRDGTAAAPGRCASRGAKHPDAPLQQTPSEQMRQYYESSCARPTATPAAGPACVPSRAPSSLVSERRKSAALFRSPDLHP